LKLYFPKATIKLKKIILIQFKILYFQQISTFKSTQKRINMQIFNIIIIGDGELNNLAKTTEKGNDYAI